MPTLLSKVDKGTAANPEPSVLITSKCQNLKDMEINDTGITPNLPIHFMLGASKYAKSKTNLAPRVGNQEKQ